MHGVITKCNGKKTTKLWTEEDDKKLFNLYKVIGSKWTIIAGDFPGRSKNEVKNRFYSTLRRVARKRNQESGVSVNADNLKKGLLRYVDDAIECGHNCISKRGRKRKFPIKSKVSYNEYAKQISSSNNTITNKTPETFSSDEIANILVNLLQLQQTQTHSTNQLSKGSLGSVGSAFIPYREKKN